MNEEALKAAIYLLRNIVAGNQKAAEAITPARAAALLEALKVALEPQSTQRSAE